MNNSNIEADKPNKDVPSTSQGSADSPRGYSTLQTRAAAIALLILSACKPTVEDDTNPIMETDTSISVDSPDTELPDTDTDDTDLDPGPEPDPIDVSFVELTELAFADPDVLSILEDHEIELVDMSNYTFPSDHTFHFPQGCTDIDGDGVPEIMASTLIVDDNPDSPFGVQVKTFVFNYDTANGKLTLDPSRPTLNDYVRPMQGELTIETRPVFFRDLDLDGRQDLVLNGNLQFVGNVHVGIQQANGSFSYMTVNPDPNPVANWSVIDHNKDGWPDLAIVNLLPDMSAPSPVMSVFLNTGEGTFENQAVSYFKDSSGTEGYGTTLFYPSPGSQNRIFISMGVTHGVPIGSMGTGIYYESDGWFYEVDPLAPDTQFRSETFSFSGIIEANLPEGHPMTIWCSDLAKTGEAFCITTVSRPETFKGKWLYHPAYKVTANSNVFWEDYTRQFGFRDDISTGTTAWPLACADFNGDGRTDCAMGYGEPGEASEPGPIKIWGNVDYNRDPSVASTTSFVDSGNLPAPNAAYQKGVIADLDNDGKPDLIFGGPNTPTKVFFNTTEPEGDYMAIQLIGKNGGSYEEAAMVYVCTENLEANDLPTSDGIPEDSLMLAPEGERGPCELTYANSFVTEDGFGDGVHYVGLGSDNKADVVVVWENDGSGQIQVDHHPNLPAGRRKIPQQ